MNPRSRNHFLQCLALVLFAVPDLLLRAATVYSPGYAFTTPAGSVGVMGNLDGTGHAARFSWPADIVLGANGNFYVADTDGSIRRVTPAGVVVTVAGSGGLGYADGTGLAAHFDNPNGIAAGPNGIFYIADSKNNVIRKMTLDQSGMGVITTVAGTAGVAGSADGTGAAARFSWPTGLVVDASGNVYVVDQANNTVRKITINPSGQAVVTTVAGLAGGFGHDDGVGSAARFFWPNGIAIDGTGTFYIADSCNFTIRKMTINSSGQGVVTTFAGSPQQTGSDDGQGANALFGRDPSGHGPEKLTVDGAGNVFVADTGNHTLRRITPAGVVTTIGGLPGTAGSADGSGASAGFNYPQGLALDFAGGLYVADTFNDTIRAGFPTTTGDVPAMPAAALGVLATSLVVVGARFARGRKGRGSGGPG